jgi:hypothetical protein
MIAPEADARKGFDCGKCKMNDVCHPKSGPPAETKVP